MNEDITQNELIRLVNQLYAEVRSTQKLVNSALRAQDLKRSVLGPDESVEILGSDGQVAARIGGGDQQEVIEYVGGPDPKTPEAPDVEAQQGQFTVTVDGFDEHGDPAPDNLKHTRVHYSREPDFEPYQGTLKDVIPGSSGRKTFGISAGVWYVRVEWETRSGKISAPSEVVAVDVEPLVDTSDLEATLAEAERIIAEAVAEAQTELDELRDRLDNFQEFDPTDLIAQINQVTEDLAAARNEAAGLVAALADRVDDIKIPDVSEFITQAEVDAAAAAAETAAKEHADLVAQGAKDDAIAEAEAKANAAREAAEQAARDYADQQDAILKAEAASDAQDKADAAQAEAERLAAEHAELVATGAKDDAIAEAERLHALAVAEAQAAKNRADEAHTEAGSAWDHADAALNRATAAETNAIAEAERLADAARAVAEEAKAENRIKDTRDDNEPPSFYYALRHPARIIEFKKQHVIGLPAAASGTYAHVITHISWGNPSGGPIRQEALDYDNQLWSRVSLNRDEWGEWSNPLADAEAAAKEHADNLPKMLGGSSGPVGTAPNGSIWFRRDENNVVTGRWERIDGSWVQQEVSGELIDNLEAGKITALHTEFAESVIGKLWTQLAIIDRLIATSAWIGGAMIGEDAVEAKHIVASESLSAKVAEFLKLSVADLVATGAEVDDAVIQKLWVDGLVGLSATLARATVASQNLIPGMSRIHEATPPPFKSGFGRNSGHPSIWVRSGDSDHGDNTVTTSGDDDALIHLEASETYRFRVGVSASKSGTISYMALADEDGNRVSVTRNGSNSSYLLVNHEAGSAATQPEYYEAEISPPYSGAFRLIFYANHTNGAPNPDSYQWFHGLTIANMLDGSLIVEDTIRTRHLHVTREMVGEFAKFMHLVVDQMNVNALWADTAWLTAIETANIRLQTVVDSWVTNISGRGMEVISPEGQPTVQLGNFDETGLTLYRDGEATASMADDGGVSGVYVSAAEEFYYRGDELSDIMLDTNALPRGAIAWGERDMSGLTFNTSSHIGFLEVSFDAEPGRAYQVVVSPFRVQQASFQRVVMTFDGSSPDIVMNSNTSTRHVYTTYIGTSNEIGGGTWRVPPRPSAQLVRILIGVYSSTAGINFPGVTGNVIMTVHDMGLAAENTGVNRSSTIVPGGTNNPDPQPPVTKTKRTTTWTMSWWRTWWQNGFIPPSGIGYREVVQGRTPYFTTAGLLRGMVGFPSMTSTLSGADIEKIEVRVRVIHSHDSKGGRVRLGLHGNTSRPSSFTGYSNLELTNTHFGRSQEKWVTLPSSVYNGFKNGTHRGVVMYTSSTSSTYYVQASPSRFAIRVTYRK